MTTEYVHLPDENTGMTVTRKVDFAAGRRAFIQCLGAGVAGAAILGTAGVKEAAAQSVTDNDILNFALNLEYLEAEFYLRAATGQGLSDSEIGGGVGTLGPVSGGRQVTFATDTIRNYAFEIASEERKHVSFLRNALGSARINRPAIDINNAFNIAASFAGLGSTFDAYANETNFLLAAFIFEDVGVSAYLGAAPLISDKSILAAAGGLLAAEAYHAGTIRTTLYGRGLYSQAQAISNARDNFDGPSDDDDGIGTATTANTSLTNPANGLAFSRTTTEVLRIVYLNGNAQPTGFFPNGLNGTIR